MRIYTPTYTTILIDKTNKDVYKLTLNEEATKEYATDEQLIQVMKLLAEAWDERK